mmetsp:Transcript_23653/g.42814  ORF Transcript_23653/g.42814 Transcript_23653/m.42814 type:complete len:283 (+) Transcript_23653:100-948(+)|eukprot:CAMPEP_0197660932 /NCGR_PEP_ID=MMETSP1338-20131121/51152_1 /TAXON_ID=43686 ORGANISM="Pelagodinium beii, Strain RCC1491" /NCGR_SAMPLE_ID=MMETSP1338 /ASSEMBLY_ACC=CAM_ASM_000754 /LENGTH=282 /DNA_ID=CAMNT_0043238391 /DNA_START=61 /DNA_END=909 /DNA_ORIENTATION=+
MLRVAVVLCLATIGFRCASAAKVASQDFGSSLGSWWPFSSNEGGPAPSEGSPFVPGEEVSQDEALPQKQEVLPPRPARPAQISMAAVATKRLPSQPEVPLMEHELQPKPVDEFDALPDGADQATDGVLAALFSDQHTSKGESVSREESLRWQAGDVEHVAPPVAKVGEAVPRQAAKLPVVSLAHSSSGVAGKPNPQAQCMKFANWAKGTGVDGKELVELLRSTCVTQAKHGDADAKFKKMCSGLEEKVAEFEDDPNWVPGKVCDILTKHFRLSGVGANPLEG